MLIATVTFYDYVFSVEHALAIIDEAWQCSRRECRIKNGRENQKGQGSGVEVTQLYTVRRELRANLRNRAREGPLHWQALVLGYIQS